METNFQNSHHYSHESHFEHFLPFVSYITAERHESRLLRSGSSRPFSTKGKQKLLLLTSKPGQRIGECLLGWVKSLPPLSFNSHPALDWF